MEHGLLHATHSSCWCCCCGSTLLLVEVEALLCCCVPARLGVELNKTRLGVEQKLALSTYQWTDM